MVNFEKNFSLSIFCFSFHLQKIKRKSHKYDTKLNTDFVENAHDLTRTVACGHVFFDILLFLLQIEAKRRRKWMTQKPGFIATSWSVPGA